MCDIDAGTFERVWWWLALAIRMDREMAAMEQRQRDVAQAALTRAAEPDDTFVPCFTGGAVFAACLKIVRDQRGAAHGWAPLRAARGNP
jgi:hypothetical protein